MFHILGKKVTFFIPFLHYYYAFYGVVRSTCQCSSHRRRFKTGCISERQLLKKFINHVCVCVYMCKLLCVCLPIHIIRAWMHTCQCLCKVSWSLKVSGEVIMLQLHPGLEHKCLNFHIDFLSLQMEIRTVCQIGLHSPTSTSLSCSLSHTDTHINTHAD